MNTVVGIFNSFADAKRASAMLRSLEIPENRISVLSPRTPESDVEANIPTSETEQPGMGTAVGGAVGGALGVAGGLQAGMVAATALIPGVGPVFALGLIGAALLGIGGATVGAAAGTALEGNIDGGLPRDELYLYEDALRRGRSVVLAVVDSDEVAARARTELTRAGAESIDAARDQWWIGLRDAEASHYASQGGDFNVDEANYRLGFEAALHPDRRGESYEKSIDGLRSRYANSCDSNAFRGGFDRGQAYQRSVEQSDREVEKHSKKAA
ncbi:MAG TPA: hypothetical protein VN696_16885 [Pyrinomonadaceae bacterium]|nr:hypothetical protein [Pyrinomonadaceae bacterium]